MSVRRPYSPAGTGRFFGILTAVVVLVPLVVVALLFLEFDILSDESESDIPAQPPIELQRIEDLPEDRPDSDLSEAPGGDETLPPEEEVAPAPPPPTELIHVVVAGDTLSAIARTFGVSLDAILAVNDIPDPNALLVGQRIVIPVATTAAETTPQPEPAAAPEVQTPADAGLPAEEPSPSSDGADDEAGSDVDPSNRSP